MLFWQETLAGIVEGRVTCAFRRWRRPRVRPGTRMRTAVGIVAVAAVEPIEAADVTDEDARRAGHADADAVLAQLRGREGDIYRIELSFSGADPRIALRERADLTDGEVEELRRRLERLDRASRRGPWTDATLAIIERRPGIVAAELAAALGVERDWFKRNVRTLKELGLTHSLAVGYELSPRGAALRARLRTEGGSNC